MPKILRNCVLPLMALLQVACATTPEDDIKLLKKLDETTLRFVGNVEVASLPRLIDALEHGIETLIITSGGGEVLSNIELARFIRDKEIKLVVEDYCMSSCFNYLFLASSTRHINENSVLGFHGSAETSVPKLLQGNVFRKTIEQERLFLKDLEFDPGLYLRLSDTMDKLIANGSEFDFMMVDRQFLDHHSISIIESWFPSTQTELNELTAYISDKYGKPLSMRGRFATIE